MVRGIGPRTLDFSLNGGFLIRDDYGVGREKVEQGAAPRLPPVAATGLSCSDFTGRTVTRCIASPER